MRYTLYRWSWTALDWVFPPTCGGCNHPGIRWCPDCQQNISLVEPPICELCGQHNPGGVICSRCQVSHPKTTQVRSWAIFDGPLRNALHRVKYHRDLALGAVFAEQLADYLVILAWELDLVMPVPLSRERMRQRGYNQAALIAKPLALKLQLAYRPQALRRGKDTRSQVGLTWAQRRQNVKNAFDASSRLVRDRAVLVVDDVATSGSTLDACAGALRNAGARDVFGLTLARAVLSAN